MHAPLIETRGALRIALVPAFLLAYLTTTDHGVSRLVVHRSTHLSSDNDLFEPVRRFLNTHCHALYSADIDWFEEFTDDGAVLCSDYYVWQDCPDGFLHACAFRPTHMSD